MPISKFFKLCALFVVAGLVAHFTSSLFDYLFYIPGLRNLDYWALQSIAVLKMLWVYAGVWFGLERLLRKYSPTIFVAPNQITLPTLLTLYLVSTVLPSLILLFKGELLFSTFDTAAKDYFFRLPQVELIINWYWKVLRPIAPRNTFLTAFRVTDRLTVTLTTLVVIRHIGLLFVFLRLMTGQWLPKWKNGKATVVDKTLQTGVVTWLAVSALSAFFLLVIALIFDRYDLNARQLLPPNCVSL